MLERLQLVRRLIPAYEVLGAVFCWKCSVCKKLFMVPPEHALQDPNASTTAGIEEEFRTHDCRLQFANALEKFEHSR